MLTEEILRKIIAEKRTIGTSKVLIEREKTIPLNSERIVVVTGVRRCGKSTLLKSVVENPGSAIFLNFEDIWLEEFNSVDFQKLIQIAEVDQINSFIFDEIQNLKDWEKYVRTAHDMGFKVFITGSNASMLSRELGTKLTGRHIQIELYPFSYQEFLTFKNENASSDSFLKYIEQGGFPEYLLSQEADYHRALARDIVIRDIAVRRNIKNDHILIRLLAYLMSSVAKEVSFNNITKLNEIKSVRTTIDYCDYLKESFLVDFIPRFSFSIKQQQINPKKVYAIDTAMAKALSLSFSSDSGRMLENTVYLMLRRQFADILYYTDETSECDFIIRQNDKIIFAVQVCYHLTSDNLERELTGLKNAMKKCAIEKGVIVTMEQEETFGEIKAIPAWKFNLNNL